MKDENGNLATGKEEILRNTRKYYKKVLETISLAEGREEHHKIRDKLAKLRMKKASEN